MNLLRYIFAGGFLLTGSVALGQSDDDCMMCHGDPSLTMVKRGKTISITVDPVSFSKSAHADLGCVTCHDGFDATAIPHARKIQPVDCLSCHDGERIAGYTESVHGRRDKSGKSAASCSDCHTTHAIQKVSDKEPSARKIYDEQVCGRCHSAVQEQYLLSDHGVALMAGKKGAPTCTDCHGEHTVQSPFAEGSPTGKDNEAAMCLSCHLDKPEIRALVGPSAGFLSSYENSVHSRAVKQGNLGAATCSDCHGSHEMKKGSNPASKVAKKNIASTCGQCHGDIQRQYERSIHGTTLAAGVTASATCTDCHGEHNILSPKDVRSPVASRNVSTKVCSPCHASVKLNEKYGLASDRFASFEDSYHGLAGRAGSVEVANCASCHGVHDILPSSDSASRINKANLVATCGTCHPGANENFTKGAVHVIATTKDDSLLYLVSTFYIVLIVVTIGGMAFHNLLDFIKKSRQQLAYRRGHMPRPPTSHRLYLRMTLNERIQHGLLLVSFILLVFTGFALRFPDAWWVASLRDLSPWMFDLRGIVHRVCGVLLTAVSLYHVWYLLATPRGKQLLSDLLPVRKDLSDAIGVMKFNLGITKKKPLLGRFSYVEKSEYWALVWGTIVMAATGVILWFDNTFLNLLTKLGWDVARTVHYYEAWLATLAILVWHFYFVIFNPHTYPINLAFWKGTLTEEEMEEEHPLELEELKRQSNANLHTPDDKKE